MKRGKHQFKILLGGFAIAMAASPFAWSAETVGKATYDKLCVSCHGADGKGNPAMAKVMGEKALNIVSKDVQAKKDPELLKVVVEGAGKMPASGKNLSPQEQKDVLTYTRSLAK